MDKWVKALGNLGKWAGNKLWKMAGNWSGFPQGMRGQGISTGCVEKFRFVLWKTWGKMWKPAVRRTRYFVELMLVMMAFTVSA